MAGIFISCFPIFSPNMSGISVYLVLSISNHLLSSGTTVAQFRFGFMCTCIIMLLTNPHCSLICNLYILLLITKFDAQEATSSLQRHKYNKARQDVY